MSNDTNKNFINPFFNKKDSKSFLDVIKSIKGKYSTEEKESKGVVESTPNTPPVKSSNVTYEHITDDSSDRRIKELEDQVEELTNNFNHVMSSIASSDTNSIAKIRLACQSYLSKDEK